jgi:hypothetical protein
MHHYVNSVFPGSAPISPMYPVMNPNAVYAMQQTYQNRAMMMPQNMYPQMQVMAIYCTLSLSVFVRSFRPSSNVAELFMCPT